MRSEEAVLGGALVTITRAEDDVAPLGVVGAVRRELGLQTHRVPLFVGDAGFGAGVVREKVGCVELQARLVGVGLHHNTGFLAGEAGG